jgi:uncharacterized protein
MFDRITDSGTSRTARTQRTRRTPTKPLVLDVLGVLYVLAFLPRRLPGPRRIEAMDEPCCFSPSPDRLAEFCKRNQVQELALFGSAITSDFGEDSDIDLLVTFQPGARIGFLTLARMRRELEDILGRKVDLVPKGGLKPAIRNSVLATARVLYVA